MSICLSFSIIKSMAKELDKEFDHEHYKEHDQENDKELDMENSKEHDQKHSKEHDTENDNKLLYSEHVSCVKARGSASGSLQTWAKLNISQSLFLLCDALYKN